MSYTLPPLTALRVFEVAGRHQSFSNAAAELNVTQGAVSRQIRTLEDELGLKLFVRETRRVILTEAGRRYLGEVQAALGQIQDSTAALIADGARKKLLISVLPSVGSYWLMPRLARFTERYPDIETRIISSIGPVDLHSREADVAIRVGALPGKRYPQRAPRVDLTMVPDWRGVLADELAPDVLVPVLAATLNKRVSEFKSARDVIDSPLIHTSSRPHAWPDWHSNYRLTPQVQQRKHEYGHFFMSLQAAREGRGIALVPEILLTDTTLSDLLPLNDFKARSAGEYYLLSLEERSKEREIRLFREWMQEQVHPEPVRAV
jgi:LysR family glycine cleavage system transcriptional activator